MQGELQTGFRAAFQFPKPFWSRDQCILEMRLEPGPQLVWMLAEGNDALPSTSDLSSLSQIGSQFPGAPSVPPANKAHNRARSAGFVRHSSNRGCACRAFPQGRCRKEDVLTAAQTALSAASQSLMLSRLAFSSSLLESQNLEPWNPALGPQQGPQPMSDVCCSTFVMPTSKTA